MIPAEAMDFVGRYLRSLRDAGTVTVVVGDKPPYFSVGVGDYFADHNSFALCLADVTAHVVLKNTREGLRRAVKERPS